MSRKIPGSGQVLNDCFWEEGNNERKQQENKKYQDPSVATVWNGAVWNKTQRKVK